MKMKICAIVIASLMGLSDGIIPPDSTRRRYTWAGKHQRRTSRRGWGDVMNDKRRMKIPLSASASASASASVAEQYEDLESPGPVGTFPNIDNVHVHESSSTNAGAAAGSRELVDMTKSSWDGWKFIKPNIDPEICFAGTTIERCSTYDAYSSKVLWTHDENGSIFSKLDLDQKKCLTATVFAELVEMSCNGSDAQVWTRTPNGKLKNKSTGKVVAKADCYAQETALVLLDEWDVPEDGCDLWVVVGPDDYNVRDIGSAFFRQIGQDISPGNQSTDKLFASSVSIDNEGQSIVVGGSIDVSGNKNEQYVAIVSVYGRSDHTWTQKATYQFQGHTSPIIPKVTVVMSGNSKRVAIAVPSANEIRVLDYDGSALTELNSPIEANSKGEMPGLKLSMDEDGSTFVVGSPYYTNGSKEDVGRVRIFDFDSNQNKYLLRYMLMGENADDRTGSDVSISDDGTLVAYGQAGHDSVGRNSGSAGLLKLVNGAWEKFGGSLIHGEGKDDETGFSVKVVHFAQKVRLAVGAIYNNGNNQVNAGHVRVFECDIANCQQWTQIGNDIDGDNGVVVDGMTFHIGDAFGYSLDMCERGDRLVVGAPFYSELRASDYYSGSVKLFEFNSIQNDWEQIGHDLVGDSNGETSGYSVGMSRDGRTLVVGSPGEPKGSAQVYVQAEVSSSPTESPTMNPTVPPPTASPTVSPTKAPTRAPTASPNKAPSTAPTKMPTVTPTLSPSATASNVPTQAPTFTPTEIPSITASNVPSQGPTITKSPISSATPVPTATDDVILSRTIWIGIILGSVLLLLCCCVAAGVVYRKKRSPEEDELEHA